MTLPTPVKTWIISPNNRIPFVSVNDTMAAYLFGIKQFLVANGYVVLGSSNGTTATPTGLIQPANDSVDRWSTAADVTTRATSAAAPQSWVVLRDGSGADILLTYQGSGDDIARISFSPGQLFTAAATSTHQPTATDEQVVSSAVSLINSATTVDRIWFGWVTSDFKQCRFAIARAGGWVGRVWGIEEFTPQVVAPAALPRAVWGFAMTDATSYLSIKIGAAFATVSAVPFDCDVRLGVETFAANAVIASSFKSELQSSGYHMRSLSIWSVTTSARGKLGDLIDTWTGLTVAADGTTYGGLLQFIAVGSYISTNHNGVWPWDGVTTPVMY